MQKLKANKLIFYFARYSKILVTDVTLAVGYLLILLLFIEGIKPGITLYEINYHLISYCFLFFVLCTSIFYIYTGTTRYTALDSKITRYGLYITLPVLISATLILHTHESTIMTTLVNILYGLFVAGILTILYEKSN